MTTAEVTFVRKPVWRLWCDLVNRDVKGIASIEEQQEVRRPDNLVDWLRALNYIQADVEAHMGDSRLRLRGLLGEPGYEAAKGEHDRRHAGRVRFLRSVRARIEECRALIDLHNVSTRTVGDLVGVLARVEDALLRDDIDAALQIVRAALNAERD